MLKTLKWYPTDYIILITSELSIIKAQAVIFLHHGGYTVCVEAAYSSLAHANEIKYGQESHETKLRPDAASHTNTNCHGLVWLVQTQN